MKNIYFTALIVALCTISSCSNEKVISVAEAYVESSICPLFNEAEITEALLVKNNRLGKIERPTAFIKGALKQMEYTTNRESSRLKWMQHKIKYGSTSTTPEEFRNELILNRLEYEAIEAMKTANGKQGFYVVFVDIRYGKNKLTSSIEVVLSKELKILNRPIDIDEVNADVESDDNVLQLLEHFGEAIIR